MKSIVFSDVHANYAALEAIFEHEKHWDEVLFLGDALQFGPHPDAVVTALRETDALCLLGNHDAEVLHVDSITEIDYPEHLDWLKWTKEQLSEKNYRFLSERFGGPVRIEREGLTILLHHGDWKFDTDTRLFPDSPGRHFKQIAERYSEPVILYGHSHIQHDIERQGRRFCNPGSAGHTRLGKPDSCYAVLEDGEFNMKQVPYDYEKTAAAMDGLPLPEPFIREWKTSFREGRLPGIYGIKDFSELQKAGYR
jgi:putative phosphoesterase